MNPQRNHRHIQPALWLGCLLLLTLLPSTTNATDKSTNHTAQATNTLANTTNNIATVNTNDYRSAFDPKGRDPFYPHSARQSAENGENGEAASPTIILALQGISGSTNRRFAIINERTFGKGEEGEVIVPNGRIRIRCLDIRNDTAVISIGNSPDKIELHMPVRY